MRWPVLWKLWVLPVDFRTFGIPKVRVYQRCEPAYRIGDSFSNIITPLMPYMPLIIAFAQKYERRIGLGTLLTLLLPYSAAFAIGWTVLLALWLLLGIPLGRGSGIVYPPM